MNETLYRLRVHPDDSPVFSYLMNDGDQVDFDFVTAYTKAQVLSPADSWRITRMSDGVSMVEYDASGMDAGLWKVYRRNDLMLQRRAEVERRLEPQIRMVEARIGIETVRAREDMHRRLGTHPADRVWRTMRRNRLLHAIAEAVSE
ncbi:MAG: hypothetical protein IPK17_38360 [Chloroflexi bacterium]|uniref:hypothetical protein n=1 Tax=Candidatus Flexifilum breve TaxID=3140694 RepID=UPI0031372B12|nr:hypothetical protein [Chloroflexota bacterium]